MEARFRLVGAGHLDPASATGVWERWETFFLLATAVLAATITLKFASIQLLEFIYLLEVLLLTARFPLLGFRMTWYRPMLRLAGLWGFFFLAALVLAIASLRFDFYYPARLAPLRYPGWITVSRLFELFLNLAVMVYLVHQFRDVPEKTRLLARTYFWVGVASAVYSMVSYPLDVLGIASLGAYANLHRFRGFYNEGGPYGLYVLSALLVGFALYRLQWETTRRVGVGMALLLVAFVMAQSKAAIFAAMALFLINGLVSGKPAQRVLLLTTGVLLVSLVWQFTPLKRDSLLYLKSAQLFERKSHLRALDGNYVYGRVAGAFIIPRMIQAHPWTGIGLGNYGTLRNAPEYRGAAVWVQDADDPGLGIIGYVADLGIPLLLYALFCLILPFFILRRVRAPVYLTNLALLQPVVHLFGGQFNLTYPWVVTGLALGMALRMREPRMPVRVLTEPLPGMLEEQHG